MPKKRLSKHRDLPKGWRWKDGAYRYRVPASQKHLWDTSEPKLGKTLAEAYRTWAEKVEHLEDVRTVKQLIERYLVEVAPFKAPRTYEENRRQAQWLIKSFGHMRINSIRPTHIYKYNAARTAKTGAKRETALLSHIYTKAVEWGYIDAHPFKGEVRISAGKPRDRYVTNDEIKQLLSSPKGAEIVKLYIEFAYITGLRKGDVLTLKREALKEDGIHVTTRKTKKKIIILWSDELRDVVDRIIASRNVDITPWLFCKENGQCYYVNGKSSGFDNLWKRLRKYTGIQDIKLHDLRAKTASDIDDEKDAQALLGHENLKMTQAYIRKPQTVRPLK